MQYSSLTKSLRQKWSVIALGAVGVAGLLFILRKAKGKKNAYILQANSSLLPIKKEIKEGNHNPEEQIYLRDPNILEEKLFRIRAGGVDDLQIIVDFDQTITCFDHNSKPCGSCFSMFRTSSLATPDYVAQAQANVLKYMPIEQDPTIPSEEKVKHLEEWWRAAERLIADLNLDREKLGQVLDEANIAVRFGFKHFMKVCEHAQLPIYIVSGGILDFMRPILAQFMDINNEGVKLFGNTMMFDQQGHFKAFASPHINSLHKEVILSKQNTEAKFRKNAILIGDSINDRLMTKNLGLEMVLSIGFLDEKKKEHLDHYMEAYDIVILGDGNFTQIEALTREVLGMPQRNAVKNLIQASESPLKQFLTFD